MLKKILAISKEQTPNRLTGVEKVILLHASMACLQSRQIWCGSMKPQSEQSSPELDFRTKRGYT